ncbi:hypothetical protein PRZ48_014598 [Zasmidium cellare]|uniref:Uncharacterized protein n=1 Tax=Zasmidium cellare TaxID=395010 RepID=A0ABR0DYT5_ZASCE|nr:hypothetical protein PRZ48_014598 [Zasmidium cellare]
MSTTTQWTFITTWTYPDPTNAAVNTSSTLSQLYTLTLTNPDVFHTSISTNVGTSPTVVTVDFTPSPSAAPPPTLPSSISSTPSPGEPSSPANPSAATTPNPTAAGPPTPTSTTIIASTSVTEVTSVLTGTTLITIPTTIPTQAPTSINISPPTQTPSNGSLPPLAVTGIGIGAGVGGGLLALLAILILFYLYRRRRRQPPHRWTEDPAAAEMMSVSTAMAPIPERKASTIDRQTTTTSTGIELLPPLSDYQLAGVFVDLRKKIRSHVEMFYAADVQAMSPKPNGRDASLARLSSVLDEEAPLDAGAMDALLQETRTRLGAIRMLIAWMILRNVEVSAPLERTLLPSELVRVVEKVEAQDSQQGDGMGCRISTGSIRLISMPDLSLAHSQTRHTTASLLSPIYHTSLSASSSHELDVRDTRRPNIDKLTNVLAQILQPYVKAGLGRQRAKDLEMLISFGAQFGYTLFSQPTTWRFDWGGGQGETDEVVVFPALVKIGDDRGQRLKRDIVVEGAEVLTFGAR